MCHGLVRIGGDWMDTMDTMDEHFMNESQMSNYCWLVAQMHANAFRSSVNSERASETSTSNGNNGTQ